MASVKIILRKDKCNKKGEAPLYLRISKDRRSKFMVLGQYVLPEHWNEETQKARKSHPNSTWLNAFIANKVAEANNKALELETKSKTVNSGKIKQDIMGKASPEFFFFANNHIKAIELAGKIGSYKRVKTIIAKLRAYKKDNPLYFDEITTSFLHEYEYYLRSFCNERH